MKHSNVPTYLSPILLMLACVGCDNVSNSVEPDTAGSDRPDAIDNYHFSDTVTWISSARLPGGTLNIARTTSDGETSEITYLTDSPYNDYKPVISPDGTQIAFFRAYGEGDDFFLWNTSICVINSDGSGFRELTGHQFMNTEPYWTRDGTNRVTWSRMVHSSEGPRQGTFVFRTASDANPGDEEQISLTEYEWSNSNLSDGRVFVLRAGQYFLMTPNSSGIPSYDLISYPDTYHYLHKGTISNDETKIAYMKSERNDTDHYRPAEIVYANFDASIPAITNEVVFVPKDESKFSWYVSISPNNEYLIYAEDGGIMLYDIVAAARVRISTLSNVYYAYPTFSGTVK